MKSLPKITIASYTNANKIISHGFDSLISLGTSDLFAYQDFAGPKLRLTFNDVDLPTDQYIVPSVEDILNIIDFVPNIKENCLIHCQAGKSRSSAAAYIVFCKLLGPHLEAEAIDLILGSATEDIFPNGRMVYIADALLDREERMWNEHVKYFGRIVNHNRNLDLIKSETRKYLIECYPDALIKFKGN